MCRHTFVCWLFMGGVWYVSLLNKIQTLILIIEICRIFNRISSEQMYKWNDTVIRRLCLCGVTNNSKNKTIFLINLRIIMKTLVIQKYNLYIENGHIGRITVYKDAYAVVLLPLLLSYLNFVFSTKCSDSNAFCWCLYSIKIND